MIKGEMSFFLLSSFLSIRRSILAPIFSLIDWIKNLFRGRSFIAILTMLILRGRVVIIKERELTHELNVWVRG